MQDNAGEATPWKPANGQTDHGRAAPECSEVISLQAHDPTTNLDFKDIHAAELDER